MSNITVLILTYNETLHLKRCIENVLQLTDCIYVVDSYSSDSTLTIAESFGVTVLQNKWENNYAKQFNWGLDQLPESTKWVLRLDADEYLLPELITEIKQKLPHVSDNINGITFKRRHYFMGKWMKKGTYPVKLLRLFRHKHAICENRWMDEHIQLLSGANIDFNCDFVDHNLNNLQWWLEKHNKYAIREAIDILDIKYQLIGNHVTTNTLSEQASAKRMKKLKYAKQPLFWRSFAYFVYRYFFKLGFTEGKEGFIWHFLQGWWYRTVVDAKIFEIEKACGPDTEKIKAYISNNYKIEL